ncbi:D-alanyl-D-alanine carboxypeptidase/D-alanyl-D-alanine endopeptidase [Streptomyces pinistramenti]|uniref:D-alanyl-D-alanine carboxypeptidase/D-alanyl-D-alanine endopeptidase n=1 Tax=Streptomyces pinistramenti TaxID=2884812 RepID=UPI001D06DDE2|nr:D-alanyl-D-alanine carboxypeptidase/D-alanyl-D-alanine-endopeptidase [Streptomyces pinistramenti]MCB5911225.1 D-alanyl-D-alanine carboxypeptidase/D-alanyl-D-alanine-endopeptidase [Streptomyces pinistramenti]
MPETGSWQVRWQSAQRSAKSAARTASRTARAAGRDVQQAWRSAPLRTRQTWRLTTVSAVAGLAVATAAVATAGPWDSGQRTAERARAGAAAGTGGEHHSGAPGPGAGPGPGTPQVLPAAGAFDRAASGRGAAPAPTGAGLAHALTPLLKSRALGPLRTASVLDVASGREIFSAKPGAASTPASTVKLATAVAALSTLGPDHRIATTVVAGSGKSEKGEKGEKGKGAGGDRIVLVGGGDPTLTARPPKGDADQRPANLHTLADDTARTLKKRGTTEVALGYDTSLYSGPPEHPIGPNENIAPVSALMADEGRLDDSDHGTAPRDADPAAAAARAFAGLLRARGIDVQGDPAAAHAPKEADRIAAVRSLPLSDLVERMLTYSDNDIAEGLARQTAVGAGEPVSFAGAATAVRKALAARQLPLAGAKFADGSGLDRDDKVTAGLLSHLLLRAAAPDHPELRPIVTGLPVAAFTGTLSDRYGHTAGAGAVRAKTGTLTGVNTLAGTVVDADGRLLVFAFMTSGTTDAQGAQKALDTLASAVANCGCR